LALTPHNPSKDRKAADKSDNSNNVFMREVDDALRKDQLSVFFERYGRLIIVLVVGSLLAFGGWIYYRHQQEQAAGIRGEEFVSALDAVQASNFKGADAALDPLTQVEQDGYRAAAQIMEGGIALERNNPKAAVVAFSKVLADEEAPQPYRDLALVRKTSIEFDDMKPADVVARLKPLAVPGNPWFGSAGEMVAIAYMDMGKNNLAGTMFLQLAEDDGVPETIRSRARQMAGVMGVDAVDDPNAAQGVAGAPRPAVPSDQGSPVE
jgi:hypothetical protein